MRGRPRKAKCKRGHDLNRYAIINNVGYRVGCQLCKKILNRRRSVISQIARLEESLEENFEKIKQIDEVPVEERTFPDFLEYEELLKTNSEFETEIEKLRLELIES
jgi:uncharacterized protein YlaN (UPF0358 family)